MEQYGNLGRDSGVKGFNTGEDFITVFFNGSSRSYRYSYRKAGRSHVEQMKALARRGEGLNAYINKYVKDLYD